ncbi:DUF1223 domain-containing protein [Spongiimicrobium sp. 3-5]|uniref:DUF1223 domain-containing protein n=1 Tax=Spongiimicrobium sp. 3-5 TaxID=3332596 RepID=UPI00397F73EA
MFKKIIVPSIVLVSLGFMAFTTLSSATYTASTNEKLPEAAVYDPIVVLELFTSQGCSSCPPADELLNRVKKEYKDKVFALSYHVDYWNYIGWTDPFSSSKYAQKQREYNLKFRNRSNYTPQVVVNGKEHFVGSSASKMYGKISAYSDLKSTNKIEISNLKPNTRSLSFDYSIEGNITSKKIRAVLVLDQKITEVKRGENRNRTLTNSNIVVSEKTIALGKALGSSYLSIPENVGPNEKIRLMLLLENADYDITGAAKIEVKR